MRRVRLTPPPFMQHPFPMRHLVACPDCTRQYDAGKLSVNAQFHCICGQILRVPRPEPHDAAVVRCSSCGGPRQESAPICAFCGADFTLHERDLHTICPGCMTRVSDRARFCHHCACPLLPADIAGEPTDYRCPSCGDSASLMSRNIETAKIAILECPSCAGLWVSSDEFSLLKERSRTISTSDPDEGTRDSDKSRLPLNPRGGPLYRPCPICGKLMNRRNYGRRSGVIIDSCRAHGVWFDAHELDSVLRWIRSGGEVSAYRREQEEKAEEKRQTELRRLTEPTDRGWSEPANRGTALGDLLGWLIGNLGI